MYSDTQELFKNEKLAMMVSQDDPSRICFPNKINPEFDCDINSPLALVSATILKAAFNIDGITLKPNKTENEISILFNNIEIQKIIISEVTNNEKNNISKTIEASIQKHNDIDKVTYVFINKESFLNQNNALEQYLKYLTKFNINSEDTYHLGTIRNEMLSNTGIYIEEYNNKNILLNESTQVSALDISHHNTFSHPIIYDVKNYESIKKDLTRLGITDIHIQSGFKHAIQTPINSFNPITNVSNYRDLNLEEVVNNKINPFLETLIERAKTYYIAKNNYELHKSQALDELAEIEMESSLIDNGNAKKLYSLKENRTLVSQNKKEIFTYHQNISTTNESNNILCINSKGTCLGNGQHSSSTFQILYLLLHDTDENAVILNEKFNLSKKRLSNLFNLDEANIYSKIKETFLTTIEKNNLSENDFNDFLEKSIIKVDWKISSNTSTLTSDIKNDNAQKEQDKSDDWINEHKEDINLFLNNYNKVNKQVIDRYKSYAKDLNKQKLSSFSFFNSIMDIRGIKTPDLSPTVAFDSILSTGINDIFQYMTFILPQNKNLSPIDAEYTENFNNKNVDSRNNLRNIYQNQSTNESMYAFWKDAMEGKNFTKPGNNNTFDSFMSCFSTLDFQRSTSKNNKYEKFLSNGRTILNNKIGEQVLEKIPAIILFKQMAETYYGKWEEVISPTNKDIISKDAFINLSFFACIQKIGKKNFSLDFIEKNGELIMKNICNSMAAFYSENTENYLKADKLKRIQTKDLAPETKEKVKHLMIDLCEPYINARNNSIQCNISNHLKNTNFSNLNDSINYRKELINLNFDTLFGQINLNKPVKKPKINF